LSGNRSGCRSGCLLAAIIHKGRFQTPAAALQAMARRPAAAESRHSIRRAFRPGDATCGHLLPCIAPPISETPPMQLLDFEKPAVELEQELEKLRAKSASQDIDMSDEIARMEAKLAETRARIYQNLTPWQRVQIARHTNRPFMLDYVSLVFTDFCELHGDRHIGDDASMPGGFARIGGRRVVVIGHQKGRDTKENLKRNFGSAHPEGYRKAIRLMKLAEKFGLPVVTLIDTPGAFPGIGAEERNIAEAIAYNLREMMLLKVPVIAVVLGEGGSGGALGIGVADRVIMLENAYYSVISPEGCAAILWKHRKHAPEAAEAMKLVAPDLKKLNLIDEVIPEPAGGAHHDHRATADAFLEIVSRHLDELAAKPVAQLLEERYAKFRNFGEWTERP
jgi:acetyl-CoA carboxylase carboxyl transferase subunit alpha